MSESTCFLTGKEPPERLYFVLSVGCVIAEYLGNTGRERSALSLRHECAKLLKFLPPGDDTEALKCTTYLAISLLCDSVDDLKGAIKYRKTSIAIQETIRDTFPDLCTWETHRILGSLYVRYGNYEKGFESLEQALVLAEDSNDKAGICHNLSQLHIALGNHEKAAEYLGKDIGKSRVTKCTEFDNLFTKGMQFQSSGKLRNAIGCFERALTISQQMKDKEAEGVICSRLGDVHLDMKNLKEALMYYELSLGLAKEVGYKDVQHVLCCQIAMLTISVDSGKAFEHLQMGLALSEELQDLHSKLLSLGIEGFISLMGGDYKQAIAAYEEALKHYEEMEALTKIKGDLKIYLGDKLYHVYFMLSRALLYDDQKIKALVVADRGRARALAALMSSKYGIPASSRYHKMLSTTDVLQMPGKGSRLLIASIIEPMVCVWFLAPQGGMKWHITVPNRGGKVSNYITSVVDESYHQMIVPQPDAKCEDRSLPGLCRKQDESNPEQPHSVPGSSADLLWEKLQKKLPMPDIFSRNTKPWNAKGPPLTILHDLMVPPVLAELLGETTEEDKAEELVFAPDGPLCLAPFAAFQDSNGGSLIDKFRIRVIPSLTTMLHILCSPADYHSNTGALIVGDPNVEVVQYNGEMHHIDRLPFAKQEAEMIGRLLKVEPLTGDKATKEEVLKRMGSVSLVHLAAHGDSERGEIALAPNPGARSGIIKEKDFLLSMGDVLNAKLRAKLVVLSCCHSGRGDIKAEGVIGIARAFLGAGARSVLVSLWGIDDEATLFFMQHFYRQLVQGKSASVANHHATRKLKNSEKFNAAKHWAPFMLIGDDVKISVDQ